MSVLSGPRVRYRLVSGAFACVYLIFAASGLNVVYAAPDVVTVLPELHAPTCSDQDQMLLHATSLTWVGSLLWSIEATSGVDRVTKGTLEKTGSSDDEVERLRERLRGIFDRGLKQYWPPGTGGTIDDLRQRIIEQLERMKAECPDAIRDSCISSINEFIRAIRSGQGFHFCLTDYCRLVNRIILLLQFLERNFALLDLNQDGKISYEEFVDYILRILIRQDPSAKPTQQELDLLKIIRELLEYYFKCGGT